MKSPSLTVLAAFAFASMFNLTVTVRAEDDTKAEAPPIPTLHCEVKTMTACSPDGKCKANAEIEGMKLPMKMTIDFENSMVAAVDHDGYARVDKVDQVVKTADQLVLHGVDGEFGWQVLISDKDEVASLVMSTADVALTGFGKCSNK
jgi:hypothetical protein